METRQNPNPKPSLHMGERDLEQAANGTSGADIAVVKKPNVLTRHVKYAFALIQSWRKRSRRPSRRADTTFEQPIFRAGYPLYSSIVGRHSEFQIFRRFRTLRIRILLIKQDQISKLEEELNDLDQAEVKQRYLGSCRKDMNGKRLDVLENLDKAFAGYDDFLQRTQWALNQPEPVHKALQSQQIMVSNAGYIARKESAYLDVGARELLSIGLVKDRAMVRVAHVIEWIVETFYIARHKLRPHKPSESFDAITISNPMIRGISRAVAASFAIILLLVPIIILNAVVDAVLRFVIVFVFSTLFVCLITISSQVSMSEIFGAGAAYIAVLVVFVSGNGVSGSPA